MFLAVFDNSPEGFLDSLSFGMLALPDPKACTKYYGNFYFEPRKVALKKKKAESHLDELEINIFKMSFCMNIYKKPPSLAFRERRGLMRGPPPLAPRPQPRKGLIGRPKAASCLRISIGQEKR